MESGKLLQVAEANETNDEATISTTPFLSATQTRYMTEHSSCAMCDSVLEIRHEVNKKDLKVREEAYCPSCAIRVRSNFHLMH